MTIATQSTPDPQPTAQPVGGGVQAASTSTNPSGFLGYLFPPDSKTPTGPEPPPPPKTTSAKEGAEEAATTSNTKSQKLDSPHQDKKARDEKKTTTDGAVAQSGVMSVNSDQSSGGKTADQGVNHTKATVSAIQDAAANDSIDAKAKDLLGPHSVLPVDEDVAITDIKAFQVDAQGLAAGTSPLSQSPLGAPVNPALANGFVNPNLQASQAALIGKTATGATAPIAVETNSTTTVETSRVQAETKKTSTEELTATPTHRETKVEATSTSTSGQQFNFQHQSGQHSSSQDKSEKPADLSTAQSMDKKTMLSDVVGKFETMMASRPKDGVVVQLSSKEHGPITLTLKTVAKSIDTQIVTGNSEVRQALSDGSGDLANAIHSRGYTVAGLTVSADPNGSTSGGNDQSGRQTTDRQPRFSSLDSRPKAETISPVLSRRFVNAGVDLWI